MDEQQYKTVASLTIKLPVVREVNLAVVITGLDDVPEIEAGVKAQVEAALNEARIDLTGKRRKRKAVDAAPEAGALPIGHTIGGGEGSGTFPPVDAGPGEPVTQGVAAYVEQAKPVQTLSELAAQEAANVAQANPETLSSALLAWWNRPEDSTLEFHATKIGSATLLNIIFVNGEAGKLSIQGIGDRTFDWFNKNCVRAD